MLYISISSANLLAIDDPVDEAFYTTKLITEFYIIVPLRPKVFVKP